MNDETKASDFLNTILDQLDFTAGLVYGVPYQFAKTAPKLAPALNAFGRELGLTGSEVSPATKKPEVLERLENNEKGDGDGEGTVKNPYAPNQTGQTVEEALIRGIFDVVKDQTDPEKYGRRREIDLDVYRQQVDAANRAAMEKTRELTRRQIETNTIQAWQGVTQAEINRDTAMGLGMMSLAYGTALPNPQVMQSAANLVSQGQQAVKAPITLI